jgi:endonuclease G
MNNLIKLCIIAFLWPKFICAEDVQLCEFWPTSLHTTKHSFYDVNYNSNLKNPRWVIFRTSQIMRQRTLSRGGMSFKSDPLIIKTPGTKSYDKSGFDRGHLCPAEDMSFNLTALKESFYTSNICPQNPTLNRGLWKELESFSREQEHIIISGPIFLSYFNTLSFNGISIPHAFFKIIYDKNNQRIICFLIPIFLSPMEFLE